MRSRRRRRRLKKVEKKEKKRGRWQAGMKKEVEKVGN